MIKKAIFASALIVALVADAAAQDTQYWTYQYGTRANLLSGAVVGSVVDISAVYYNPGGLALLEDPDVLAAQKVFELSDVKFTPSAGIEASLNDLRLDLAPGFFAGLLPFRFLGDDVLAYSIFSRLVFKADLNSFREGDLDEVIDTLAGAYFSNVRFNSDLNETWVGLSYSSMYHRTVGIGISLFVPYRSQKGGSLTNLTTLSDTDEGAISLAEQGFSYWNAGLLFKGGITLNWLGVSLGATVTTPRLGLVGEGKVLVNRTLIGVGDVLVADYQDGLSSTFRSPWSAALGASYKRAATTVHVTAEYFGHVDEFTVLAPEPFVGQSSGDTLSVEITQALDDVLNFGIGVEQVFTPSFSGYTSFRTDYSAKPAAERQSNISLSSWNIYFVTVGTGIRVGTAEFTLGVVYGWGSAKDRDLTDLIAEASGPEFPRAVDAKYHTYRFILTLAI